MPETLFNALRSRLVRSKLLVQYFEDLHVLSGMDCSLLDPLGNQLLTYPRGCSIALCRALKKTQHMAKACARCRQSQLGHGAGPGPLCVGGLRELTQLIEVDGRSVGYWVLSGYRDPVEGLAEAKDAWVHSAREGGGVSWPAWRVAWEATPVLTPSQANALLRWMKLAVVDTLRHLEVENFDPIQGKAFPKVVRQACAQARDRHEEPLKLTEVAAHCGVSPEYLSRLFHQTTGLRFREYLAEVRLTRACEMLLASDARVADIAAQVGYGTLSRFNSGFLSFTGMTPTAYRKRKKRIR